MDPFAPRELGRTGVTVTPLGFGAGQFGEYFELVSEADAQAACAAAYGAGVRLFDTAPWYGLGLSEHRLGTFLRNKQRDTFVVMTKVGRVLSAPAHTENFDNGV